MLAEHGIDMAGASQWWTFERMRDLNSSIELVGFEAQTQGKGKIPGHAASSH